MTVLPGRVRPARARQLSISRATPGSLYGAAPAPRSWCPAVSTVHRNQFESRPLIIGLSGGGGKGRGDEKIWVALRPASVGSIFLSRSFRCGPCWHEPQERTFAGDPCRPGAGSLF